MSNGFDSGGAKGNDTSINRLICASPPGPPGEEAQIPNVFVSNVVKAQTGDGPLWRTFAVGIANFSMEFWLLLKYAPNLATWAGAPATESHLGYRNSTTQWGACFMIGSDFRAQYKSLAPALTASVTVAASAIWPGWRYIAINFDRTGNMELFVDAQSRGTVAINAGDLLTGEFSLGYGEGSSTPKTPFVCGPMAFHSSLLTVSQIENAFRTRRVNNLGATSFCVYLWPNVTNARFYRTAADWDAGEDPPATPAQIAALQTLMNSISVNTPTQYLLGVTREGATVATEAQCPDLSTNNNHHRLAEEVTQFENGVQMFGYDPFFA